MGKVNTITKDYMSNPKYFADSFNYYLFDGKQVSEIAKSHREEKEKTSSSYYSLASANLTILNQIKSICLKFIIYNLKEEVLLWHTHYNYIFRSFVPASRCLMR